MGKGKKWEQFLFVKLGYIDVEIIINQIQHEHDPEEPPEDGEMNEMTLPSRHRHRNSSPGGVRPSTLPLSHRSSPQYLIFTSERRKNILFL